MSAMEREDPTKPETWKMEVADSRDVAGRCLAGLRSNGIPATRVELDATKLKGGYICDTMRVKIYYGPGSPGGSSAGDAGGGGVEAAPRRGAVSARPETAILKIASPASADHDVAMRLRLYEREWHFYETLSHRVPIRVPRWLGSVKDVETGLTTEGVLLEDLDVPGAVLCPQLDDAGVLLTIQSGAPRRFRDRRFPFGRAVVRCLDGHRAAIERGRSHARVNRRHIAKHHASFWNAPELASGALGVKPHNGPWYQPGWGDDLSAYWPKFVEKWSKPDARRSLELPPEAFAAGEAIINKFAWVQDELSKKPHTFNHGDVKPPNMFMMPNSVPAFIDWQYTAVGKGCQDIIFFLIEGYTIDECRRLEPIALKHYHAALTTYGVTDYSFDDLKRDWQLASMHFPFYVAMWFGTTPDETLVDPDFPRRFVPRAFDCILRNGAHRLLEETKLARVASDLDPRSLSNDELVAELTDAKLKLKLVSKERDALKAKLDAVKAALA